MLSDIGRDQNWKIRLERCRSEIKGTVSDEMKFDNEAVADFQRNYEEMVQKKIQEIYNDDYLYQRMHYRGYLQLKVS